MTLEPERDREDCRVDVITQGGECSVLVTHLPTGATGEARGTGTIRTRAEAFADLDAKPAAAALAERVAALEALLLPREPGWTPEMVEEVAAERERHLSEEPPFGHRKYESAGVLPPGPPRLTPETVRALLSECVTVVKPGEVLAVRLPLDFSPDDMGHAREYARTVELETGVKVAFIPGDDFAVAQAGPGNSPDNLTTEG